MTCYNHYGMFYSSYMNGIGIYICRNISGNGKTRNCYNTSGNGKTRNCVETQRSKGGECFHIISEFPQFPQVLI
jgi:hypothetical protein